MNQHRLKTWPEQFRAVRNKDKRFEVRRDDRGFEVGDTLILCEFRPETEEYSGSEFGVRIIYKLEGGQFGIEEGYCVLGIE